MPSFFVYYGAEYYPYAEVVEAESPEKAVDAGPGTEPPVAVFPVDACMLALPNRNDWGGEDDAVEALIARSVASPPTEEER